MNSPSQEPPGLILLVEDDPNQVLFIKRAMAKVKITNPLQVARNGEQAVALLSDPSRELPSLVLLDLKVPRIRGMEVLDWMRSRPELREIPVVVVTSSIDPEHRRRADELGVVAYLCKPVYPEGLLELMDMVPWLHLNRS